MEYAIETEGLTKYYGRVRGIEDLALRVRPGEVFGFLDPNGAGKTTTIRLLLNLLHPTRGSARVLGMDVQRQSLEVRRRCGVVSGEPAFYDSLSGMAHVELVQSFHGDARARRIGELAWCLLLEPGKSVAVPGLATALIFFLNMLAPSIESAAWLQKGSLFYYFDPFAMMFRGEVSWAGIGVYLGVMLGSLILAIAVFQRKDVVR